MCLQDHNNIVDFAKRHYGKDVPETETSLKGWNWGDVQFEGVCVCVCVRVCMVCAWLHASHTVLPLSLVRFPHVIQG